MAPIQHLGCHEQGVGSQRREIPCATQMATAWALQLTNGLILTVCPHHPPRLVKGLPSANLIMSYNVFVFLDQLWTGPNPEASLSHKEILSLLTPGSQNSTGRPPFCFILHRCVLQFLVYRRIAEFVCTLINSPSKCFDVIISWFLGIPSTKEVSRAEGSLFIVLFLLVGVDPCLPAQGQCALPSINPCGLKDTTIIHSLAPFRFVCLIVFHEGLHQVLGPLGSGSLFGG